MNACARTVMRWLCVADALARNPHAQVASKGLHGTGLVRISHVFLKGPTGRYATYRKFNYEFEVWIAPSPGTADLSTAGFKCGTVGEG